MMGDEKPPPRREMNRVMAEGFAVNSPEIGPENETLSRSLEHSEETPPSDKTPADKIPPPRPGLKKTQGPSGSYEIHLEDLAPSAPAAPMTVIGLSDAQLAMIAEQLKSVTIQAMRESLAPPAPEPRPSLAVRAGKKTWKTTTTVSIVLTILSAATELAARAILGQTGPWSKLVTTLGRLLEMFGQ
jgi:hypothetical protein